MNIDRISSGAFHNFSDVKVIVKPLHKAIGLLQKQRHSIARREGEMWSTL